MAVTSTRASLITGAVFFAVLTAFTLIDIREFTTINNKNKWFILAMAFVIPVAIGAAVAFRFRFKQKTVKTVSFILLCITLPLISIMMTESLNAVSLFRMSFSAFLLNYILILLFYAVIFALSGSIRVSVLAVNTILYLMALTNCYLMYFRGSPFLPMDLTGASTGMNVASSYRFRILYSVVLGTYLFILTVVIGIKTNSPKMQKVQRIVVRSSIGVLFIILTYLFYFTSFITDVTKISDVDVQWNQAQTYKQNGFAFSFFFNTKYLLVITPDGYDQNEIVDLVREGNETDTGKETKTPNIICIMNESLSDLGVLGDFTTNIDYMPFIRSLTENTVRGNLYVPVVGGGTSNTEFEFLTGNSVAFLPSGSNAYMLYVNNPMNSLVSTLEAQGYSSLAMHPYYASGWNRVSVYNNFGFNKFLSIEDMIDSAVLDEYANNGNPDYFQDLLDKYYPGNSNMLIRQHISDEYNYKLIIEDFENRDKSKPYFIFDITMQNHNEYVSGGRNFDECVTLTGEDEDYPQTNKYLSLVKASDDAFKELIEYFKNIDEPTVICMFGDHQPAIESDFIASVMGVGDLNSLTVEQAQKRHITPFIIWANYDIEEQNIERLSSNYLSSLLLDIAGTEMTDYNKYLLNLSKTIPVIDTVGYIDSSGVCHKFSEKNHYTELINTYKKIQYNNLFDNENKKDEVFYLFGFKITNDDNGGEVTQ
ncbi:MAG: sulfatase-like hydrolase/transferase [Clostridia bacterium]|nr:sulfatase-like hydrolase/transferase [Clostridia bacterium]